MKTVRGKPWGVPRGKPFVKGWVSNYRPELAREREEQERPDIACLYYGDLENETPEQFLLRQEEAALLYQAIDRLDARLARVIRLRMEGMLLDEIGEQFGVSKERIRQMQCKAERKLLKYLKHDFRERFLGKAKCYNWWWELEKTKEAEQKAQEAEWKAQREAREAERLKQQQIMIEREREALEASRVRAENARRRHGLAKLYVPHLIDPRTGAWEWVAMSEYVDDASAA